MFLQFGKHNVTTICHLTSCFSDDKEDASQSQKRQESSSSVESITPRQFYRKSSSESTASPRLDTKPGRKRKHDDRSDSPPVVETKLKKKQVAQESVSPDLISDHEEEKENRRANKIRGSAEDTPKRVPSKDSEDMPGSSKTRRESDEMVAPSPHSTSVVSQRMRKRVQRGTKTPTVPAEENEVSDKLDNKDTPVTHKKKIISKFVEQEQTKSHSGSSVMSTDEIELAGNRRCRRTAPSDIKTPTRKEKQNENLTTKGKQNEEAKDVNSQSMEEIIVRRSPRSRSGSADTGKSGSSEESTPLLKQIHTKKLKKLQTSNETFDSFKTSSDQNIMENGTSDTLPKIRQGKGGAQDNLVLSTRKKLRETDAESPVPSPKTKRLKEVSRGSPVRVSPRTKSKEPKTSKVQNTPDENKEEIEEIITTQETPEGKTAPVEYTDMDLDVNDKNEAFEEGGDIEIVIEVDEDVESDGSEEFLDASEVQEEEEEFVDASEELPSPESSMETNHVSQPEVIEISDNNQESIEKNEAEEIKTPTNRKRGRTAARVTKDTKVVDEMVSKETREESTMTRRGKVASGQKGTPKDSPQVDRLRNRRRIESDDEEAELGPTQEIRRIMGDLSESPQKSVKRSSKDKSEKKSGSSVNRDKQSPRVARMRNNNIVETSEDELTGDETPILRRSRRTHKDSPLLKEIHSPDGDFASPVRKKKSDSDATIRPTNRAIGEETPKDSPQFARLRNRRRIESSDEESAAEETPEIRRSKRTRTESPLVKVIEKQEREKERASKTPNAAERTGRNRSKEVTEEEKEQIKKSKIDAKAKDTPETTNIREKAARKLTEIEEDSEVAVVEQNEISGSDDSLEQFKTPSQKVDREVTLNYKSPSPVKVDREITLNIGRNSPKLTTPWSGTRTSSKISRRNTPKMSPFIGDAGREKSDKSELSPTRISPRQSSKQETPKSPPRHKHSELEELWEHTPKGHYGRWKRPGPVLYKVPSPPHVTRVVSIGDVSSSGKKGNSNDVQGKSPQTDEVVVVAEPSKGKNFANQPDPKELFARSPRILRASRASPSPSKSAKGTKLETSSLESPKTTPRSTRKTRQTSGGIQTDSPSRRTPRTKANEVAERRSLRSPAMRTPSSNR